jgi:3-oxoacyl-[acyl-carrier-protein] synthase III
MIYARISGTGSYLPGTAVSNDELIREKNLASSHEWIVERTGIERRHIAPSGTKTSDLALIAARNALEASGRGVDEVDLIVVATTTPDGVFPSVAAIVQDKLGIRNRCPAFDVQAVCSGFSHALVVAEKFIKTGDARCALVIGAEVFSGLLDWTDRGTCVLFGDGAGAVILEASDEPGILASALHADGSQRGILSVPGGLYGGQAVGDPFLRMDGRAVFKVAVNAVVDIAGEVLQKAGKTVDDLDIFIPHQANIRIIQMAAQKLSLPESKCISTVADHGNTSAASIPLALDSAVRSGRVTEGMNVMLIGVGGGFTWGASLMRMGRVNQ